MCIMYCDSACGWLNHKNFDSEIINDYYVDELDYIIMFLGIKIVFNIVCL